MFIPYISAAYRRAVLHHFQRQTPHYPHAKEPIDPLYADTADDEKMGEMYGAFNNAEIGNAESPVDISRILPGNIKR